MGLKANVGGGKKFDPVEAGAWRAICVGYADLGTQTSTYQGETKEGRKVMLFWDIPDQRVEIEGESLPRRISARYGLSLHEKANFRKVMDGWFGSLSREQLTGFDLDQLIGKACLLNVIHEKKDDGRVFAKVAGVSPLPKGMQTPVQETPAIKYQIEDETTGDFVVPTNLPRWVQVIISESYEGRKAGFVVPDKDEAPF